uniref:Uncharacterized protein n=1 Tax=Opuntia streptacantha TaxID=393608 RepID=A0A7C9DEM5_OPUST
MLWKNLEKVTSHLKIPLTHPFLHHLHDTPSPKCFALVPCTLPALLCAAAHCWPSPPEADHPMQSAASQPSAPPTFNFCFLSEERNYFLVDEKRQLKYVR